MYIYADVFFIENAVINFLIIFVTAEINKEKIRIFRIVSAALLGAAYATISLLIPNIKIYYSLTGKLFMSVAMLMTAFNFVSVRRFVRHMLSFYCCTFIFAGASYAFNAFDIKTVLITVCFVTVIIIISFCVFKPTVFQRKTIVNVIAHIYDKKFELTALVDSGNLLIDPVTYKSIIVAEICSVTETFPCYVVNVLRTQELNEIVNNELCNNKVCDWTERIRAVPYTSVNEGGIMTGIRVDRVDILCENKTVSWENTVICFCDKKISQQGDYNSLISPEMLPA